MESTFTGATRSKIEENKSRIPRAYWFPMGASALGVATRSLNGFVSAMQPVARPSPRRKFLEDVEQLTRFREAEPGPQFAHADARVRRQPT